MNTTSFTWVQCEDCFKWRKISNIEAAELGINPWYCWMNTDPDFSSCDKDEESFEDWEAALDTQGFTYSVSEPLPTVNQTTRSGRTARVPARFQD